MNENIKKGLTLINKLGKDLSEGLADKHLTLTEYITLGLDLLDAPAVIKSWSGIKAEFKAMTPESRQELIDWEKTQFDIADDKVEARIEAGLDALEAIAKLVDTF